MYLINSDRQMVMGIINTSPDSFYSGSRVRANDALIFAAESMLNAGADLIDIGGHSTRPMAEDISLDEELSRVIPAIEILIRRFEGIKISVDTFRAPVAEAALNAGAYMINDVFRGEEDPDILQVTAKFGCPYVLTHSKGNHKTMQSLAEYEDLIPEMLYWFSEKINELKAAGIADIIIDPGFGFGKTIEHNFEILSRLNEFKVFNLPILVGISRKSMIYKTFDSSANEALNGTTVLNTYALLKGADILRVHDVKEAVETRTLLAKLRPKA